MLLRPRAERFNASGLGLLSYSDKKDFERKKKKTTVRQDQKDPLAVQLMGRSCLCFEKKK